MSDGLDLAPYREVMKRGAMQGVGGELLGKLLDEIEGLRTTRTDLLAAAKRALNVLRAQGEGVRPGNALGALVAAINKAEGR